MGFYVYILQSESTGRHYCGQTNNLERRIREHNDPFSQSAKTTKRYEGPWRLAWSISIGSRGDAMILERRIKKRGIQRFLEEQV